MPEIDDMFRRFQEGVAPLPPASRDQILTRVRRGTRRTPLTPSRRTIATVAGVLCLAGAMVAALSLRTATTSRVDAAEAPRVAWGRILTLKVVPDAGVSNDAAIERARAALLSRGTTLDVPGISVKRTGATQLEMTVPGLIDSYSPMKLAWFTPIEVFDRASGRLASYNSSEEMRTGLSALTPSSGYLIVPRPMSEALTIMWVATRGEAVRQVTSLNKDAGPDYRWEAIPTPANASIIAPADRSRFDIVRSQPILRATDITDVRPVGANDLILTLAPDARRRVAAAIATGDLVAVTPLADPYLVTMGRVTAGTGAGTVRVTLDGDGGAESMAAGLAPAPVPGTIKVVSTRQYGALPKLAGERVVALPDAIDAMRRDQLDLTADTPRPLATPVEAVRRVVTATHGGREVSVYAARLPDGQDAVYGDLGIGQGNLCTPGMGPPSLMACPTNFTNVNQGTLLGRIGDPDITSVTVTTLTGTYPAVVQNGWYLAFPRREDMWPPTRERVTMTVTGRNDRGDVVAELDLPAGTVRRHAP